MAHRELEVGDEVRIVRSSGLEYHGTEGKVIAIYHGIFSDEYYVEWSGFGKSGTAHVSSDKLILLDKEVSAKVAALYAQHLIDEDDADDYELPEPCGTCPCCEAHDRM